MIRVMVILVILMMVRIMMMLMMIVTRCYCDFRVKKNDEVEELTGGSGDTKWIYYNTDLR